MNTNHCDRPEIGSVDDLRLGFGLDILDRMEGIRGDVALVGVPGVLSVIEALIASDELLDRESLVRKAKALCRPDMSDTVEELVDFFEGDHPRRYLWSEVRGGYFRRIGDLGPYADFVN